MRNPSREMLCVYFWPVQWAEEGFISLRVPLVWLYTSLIFDPSSTPFLISSPSGEACAIEATPFRSPLDPELLRGMQQDELLGQVFCPPPRFVLISTAGVLEVERRR